MSRPKSMASPEADRTSAASGVSARAPWRALAAAVAVLALAPALIAKRTEVKPGWNVFSPEQDVELGRTVAADAERKLPMLNDRRVDDYLNNLGRRLAGRAPGERYPYQFRAVNDRAINAFALPGGFLFVNRGVIEAAQNEAQLAGVMGHEIGHVALRHGTNQATKSYAAQVPLAVLGGVLGSNSIGSILAQIGADFAVNSVLLRYSRTAEQQADIVGTQLLYDNGYDPRAMAQFFEIINAQARGGRGPEWLSSHPNPDNRVGKVNQEIQNLGGVPASARTDSTEFQQIKRYVQGLPGGTGRTGAARRGAGTTTGRPQPPSSRFTSFRGELVTLQHPDNWRAYGQGGAFTLAPDGGIVSDRSGNAVVAYGVVGGIFEPHSDRQTGLSLEEATDQLIHSLERSNPGLRVIRDHERERIGGVAALSTLLRSDSPLGDREYDWLITMSSTQGLAYFVFIAPQNEFDDYERTFSTILHSVRFRR